MKFWVSTATGGCLLALTATLPPGFAALNHAWVGRVAVPNPTVAANSQKCNVKKPAFVCDQDAVLGAKSILSVAKVVTDLRPHRN